MTKKEDGGKQAGAHGEHDNALSARRARLRGSLSKQKSDTSNQDSPLESNEQFPNGQTEDLDIVGDSFAPTNIQDKKPVDSNLSRVISAISGASLGVQDLGHAQEISLLNNIDQALGSCATHLASLQKVADEQIDELKLIAKALQNQTVPEAGSNINMLMESLTAAVEPMKVMGELVPVLDRLVSATEAKDQSLSAAIEPMKALSGLISVLERFVSVSEAKDQSSLQAAQSHEQLVISLAKQLVAGSIDPWTFKSAYMAIFPDEDATILVHRLGELLSGQQLSPVLFQAAYAAIQLQQPVVVSNSGTPGNATRVAEAPDEHTIEANKLAFMEREEELKRQLAIKEEEFENIRMQLDTQWKELATECEELRSALQDREYILTTRDTELQKKINELASKDSENQQLRAQMEQLRDETKAMMTDLQKQLTAKRKEDNVVTQSKMSIQPEAPTAAPFANPAAPQPNPQSGFFDFVSTSSQKDDLFTAVPKSPQFFTTDQVLTDSQADTANVPIVDTSTASAWDEPNTSVNKVGVGFGTTNNVAVNTSAPTMSTKDSQTNTGSSASFVSAVGSYGSGVRAQVFEVIVRQALAGTQWRAICAVPMQSNNISPDEVEAEVKRRQALLKK